MLEVEVEVFDVENVVGVGTDVVIVLYGKSGNRGPPANVVLVGRFWLLASTLSDVDCGLDSPLGLSSVSSTGTLGVVGDARADTPVMAGCWVWPSAICVIGAMVTVCMPPWI